MNYFYFLLIQFIGIVIGFIEIIFSKNLPIIMKTLAYIFAIIIPFLVIMLEKININAVEYIYFGIAKLTKLFNRSKAKKKAY